MRVVPARRVDLGRARTRILTPSSPEFTCAAHTLCSSLSATAWPSANKPVALPFRLSQPVVVYQLGWLNGNGTMTDSFDIGIYTPGWTRLVSGGGTARSGVSTVQWVDVTDTALPAGKYYLVGVNNGTTAGQVWTYTAALTTTTMGVFGILDSGTDAYTLPDPLTNMVTAATFTRVPPMMIACRAPF